MRLKDTSNVLHPHGSDALLVAALSELQDRYAHLKEGAEERERLAEQEVAWLTLKVTSLEEEVTALRASIEVRVLTKTPKRKLNLSYQTGV